VGLADALPGTLSGGEAARAGLAVALASDPDIVICDEPTAETDRASEAVVLARLRASQQGGTAILVATHSPVIARSADRLVEIRDGEIVA